MKTCWDMWACVKHGQIKACMLEKVDRLERTKDKEEKIMKGK